MLSVISNSKSVEPDLMRFYSTSIFKCLHFNDQGPLPLRTCFMFLTLLLPELVFYPPANEDSEIYLFGFHFLFMRTFR